MIWPMTIPKASVKIKVIVKPKAPDTIITVFSEAILIC